MGPHTSIEVHSPQVVVLEEPNSRNWFTIYFKWIKPFNAATSTPVQMMDTTKSRRFLRNVQWTPADHCELNTANEIIWKENELLIIPQEHIDLLLHSVYKDPKMRGGRDQIYQYIKENFVGVSRRRIMEFLRNQESYQLWFREKKPRITTPIFISEVNGHWQVDLINFQKYNERGFKWILTVVDVFSKYLWAGSLKNKSAEEVKEAFSHIFKERRPIVLQARSLRIQY